MLDATEVLAVMRLIGRKVRKEELMDTNCISIDFDDQYTLLIDPEGGEATWRAKGFLAGLTVKEAQLHPDGTLRIDLEQVVIDVRKGTLFLPFGRIIEIQLSPSAEEKDPPSDEPPQISPLNPKLPSLRRVVQDDFLGPGI